MADTFVRDFGHGPPSFLNAKTADWQVIGEEISIVAERVGGKLKAEHVVDAARSPKSRLHRHFEWRDKLAAEAWRQEQARSLIRTVGIVAEGEDADDPEATQPAFLNIHQGRSFSYRALAEISGSVELQRAVLRQADNDLKLFQARYRRLADICDSIEDIRAELKKRRGEGDESGLHP